MGSTGMLGSEVVRVARRASIEVIEVSRSEGVIFDASAGSFEELAQRLKLGSGDYLVNCVGWIPQKAFGNVEVDTASARLLNERLPEQINQSVIRNGFHWVQIGTDCVFDARLGGYSESSPKDAQDIYGLSKIKGEEKSNMAMLIRSSIIGPDSRTAAGLYSWFLGEATASRPVVGYTNHLWNGVSTFAFARLAVGLAQQGNTKPFTAHWIPSDEVTKFDLLRLFAKYLRLTSDLVAPGEAESSANRTLTTNHEETNHLLWRTAGYDPVPSVWDLVAELVSEDQGVGP